MFCWIPGHIGINGNEIADAIAKSTAISNSKLHKRSSSLNATDYLYDYSQM